MLVAPLHEGADRRGSRVEHRHAMSLADLPEPVPLGPFGRALVHEACRAVREWTVHVVRVSRHPHDVRRVTEVVMFAQVTYVVSRRSNVVVIEFSPLLDTL